MKKKIYILLAVVMCAILLRYLFSVYSTHMMAVQQQKNRVTPVTITKVDSVKQQKTYEIPARVVSKSRIDINARINGYLTKSYFKEGDYVKAGQVLFEIEPQEYALAVQRAKSEVDRTRAQQVFYDKQAQRAKQLVEKDYIARSDYDNAIAQRDAYRAQTTYAEMAYNDAVRNLSYTKVKAPVSGRVGIISVTVGNYVTINSGALTTIYSTRPMYVTFPLEMEQYNTLAALDGQNANRNVEYIFSNGTKYDKKGIQDFRDNKVDESTGTIRMRATFTNEDDALISGDFGKIRIYSNNLTQVPVIPSKTIQENQEGKFVYRLDEKNIPSLVHIKVLTQKGNYSYISEGLEIGDTIVESGILKVMPGVEVKVVEPNEYAKTQQKTTLLQKVYRKIFKRGNK